MVSVTDPYGRILGFLDRFYDITSCKGEDKIYPVIN
jgi:hypothetical protein